MAINNVTTNTKPEKGITYSAITDSSVDWTGITNSTYFYDKATDLPYYKNSSGDVVSLFEEGGGGDSIYTADGTLTGNRILSLSSNDLTFNGTGLFKISNGSKSVYPNWNVHSAFNIDNGNGTVWTLYNANASSTFNANEFGIGVGSSIPFRIFNNTSVALGGVGKSSLDTNYSVQTNGNTLIGGSIDAKSGTNLLSFDFANYSKIKIGTSTSQWWFVNSNAGNSSTFDDNDLYLWDSTNSRKVVRFNANGSTELLNKVELSTTTDGFLMPRLTTAQKNAISSPDTNLMVFDTDLSSLQRYNGTAWVAVAAGYGIIEVIKDSDNGNPTFYSDLQSALETCKTAGSSNTINIYSNITITSAININRGGSGVGNGYQYKNLTIDFNGFILTNNETDSSYCFDVSFGNITSENRKLTFKNGIVNRTSGTGTHYALHCDETENDGDLIMYNMKWYCENSNTVRLEIDELDSSYKDFGGSVFESDAGTPLRLEHYSCKNFTTISNSSLGSLVVVSGAKATNFEVINTSTGDGIDIGGDSDVSFFKVKTTSGIGIDCSDNCEGVFTNFYIETTTGDGIDTLGTNATYKLRFSNFEIRCDNGTCIDSNHTNTIFSNFTLSNNGSSYTISTGNNVDSTFSNGTAINYGSGQVVYVGNTNGVNFKHINFISKGGSVGTILLDSSTYSVYFENCTFHTEFNDAAGRNLTISNSTGTIVLTTCSFRVANSSANCLYATSTKTISVSNSNFNGSTTPINSNITLNHLESDAFGNVTT
jgi:hypothetical protein